MSNDPDLVDSIIGRMLEPHDCDTCGETYDEASGDGYAGNCPACADAAEEDDEDDDGWECDHLDCGYRTDGMSLADRGQLTAHLAEQHP